MNILTYTLEKKIPIFIQFNLTRRCNLRCIHCCIGNRKTSGVPETPEISQTPVATGTSQIPETLKIPKTPEKATEQGEKDPKCELTLPEVSATLEQLARAGCLVLTLSGGEVLMREDLFDIISRARKLGFAVRIFTNATLVGKKERDAFRKLHVQEVHVSLYAAEPAIHDGITGVTGSWARTLEAIRLLRDGGIPVKIKCAIMRQNVEEYHKVYTLAVNMGAGYAFDPVITARDNGDRDPLKYRIDQEDLRRVLSDPIFQQGETANDGNIDKGGIEGGEKSICLQTGTSDDILCSAGHYICCISPEGDVTPCVQLPISCGNIRDSHFDWIWHHSPEMIRIRHLRMKDLRGCGDCHHLPWCARCPGLAYLEDGDLLGPSSAACWMVETRKGG